MTSTLYADISGVVYRDYNNDATQGVFEPGVGGLTVTAFAEGQTPVTTVTGPDGSYLLSGTGAISRVEVTDIPSFLQPGPAGAGSLTTTFVAADGATDQNVALVNPGEFCDGNPDVVVPCYVNGDPLVAGTSADTDWLVRVDYTPTDDREVNEFLATGTVVGATWGVTYQRQTETLFSAAVVKRHSGLGLNGAGAIYQTSQARNAVISDTSPPISSLFVNLADPVYGFDFGPVPSNSARGLIGDASAPNNDPDVFDLVGKTGIGGIELSEDGRTLYVINLFTKSLIELPVGIPAIAPAAADVREFPITLQSPAVGVVNGEFRPWAVGVKDGEVYVGGVATAENPGGGSSDLRAYVLQLNDAGTFDIISEFALDFERESVAMNNAGVSFSANWQPWVDTFPELGPPSAPFRQVRRPQPMFTDIEFDSDGSLILGFNDRTGMQAGNDNYGQTGTTMFEAAVAGDILRLQRTASGFELAEGTDTTSGPGLNEFYQGDAFVNPMGTEAHQEITLGGLASCLSEGTVVSSVFDPVDDVRSGGLRWFSNTDGTAVDEYEIFGRDEGGGSATFGKAAGIGDVVLVTDAAPVEVGNFVWADANGNGIQDPNEAGIANVLVTLSLNGTTYNTTTDATGRFIFSSAGNAPSLGDFNNEGSSAVISIDLTNSAVSDFTGITVANNDSSANGDLRDSDAVTVGDNAQITFVVGGSGENNHALDIGLLPPRDYGDAPDTYLTTESVNGASHSIVANVKLGASVDAELDGNPSTDAQGDGADENGVTFSTTNIPVNNADFTASVNVMAMPDVLSMVTLAEDAFGTNDFTGGIGWTGDWVETGEGNSPDAGGVQVTGGRLEVYNNDNSASRTFNVPVDASDVRLKFDYDIEGAFNGSFLVQVNGTTVATLAQADAPGSIDIDITGALNATGASNTITFNSDLLSNVNDDEGFNFDNLSIMATETIVSTTPYTLIGWVDFDRSGTFEADEASVINTAGGLNNNGTNTLTWTGTEGLINGAFGETYARFRLSSDPNLTVNQPGGSLSDGEVEDYLLNIPPLPSSIGGFAFLDVDNDGVFNNGDTPLAGTVVQLLDGAGNPIA